MLYLVTPTGLEWTGDLGQEAVDIAREHGKDLGVIEGWWQPAEARMNADHIRSALRWGLVSTRGIVVAATHTVVLQRPHELGALIAETVPRMKAYRESHQVRLVDEVIEAQAPGWKAYGAQLDADVDRSMNDSLATAIEDAQRQLAENPVDSVLKSHWLALGGVVPQPE